MKYLKSFRLAYMKEGRSLVGWKRFSYSLILFGFITSVICTITYLMVRSPISYILEVCMAPDPQLFAVLSDYNSERKFFGTTPKNGRLLKFLGVLLKQIELVIYGLIYRVIIKHNKSMAPLIGPRRVKRRINRSIVTLRALFYSHSIKTIGWCFLLLDPSNRSVLYTGPILADIAFAIEASLEAISVQETRQIFTRIISRVFPFISPLQEVLRNKFIEQSSTTKFEQPSEYVMRIK